MLTLFSCGKCCSSSLLLDAPSAFQCMMLMTGCSFNFDLVFLRPVALLVRPLTPQDEPTVPPIAFDGFLRDREPGTAHAWWVLTGRAPYRLVVISSVIMAVCAWCSGLLRVRYIAQHRRLQHPRFSVGLISPLTSEQMF